MDDFSPNGYPVAANFKFARDCVTMTVIGPILKQVIVFSGEGGIVSNPAYRQSRLRSLGGNAAMTKCLRFAGAPSRETASEEVLLR